MKRLVLLIVALIFSFCSIVIAGPNIPTIYKSDEDRSQATVKEEKADVKKADVKKVKKAKKAKKKKEGPIIPTEHPPAAPDKK
jgi:hypothetical protein